jgi:hypothetical protein
MASSAPRWSSQIVTSHHGRSRHGPPASASDASSAAARPRGLPGSSGPPVTDAARAGVGGQRDRRRPLMRLGTGATVDTQTKALLLPPACDTLHWRGHERDAAEHANHGPLRVALAGGARPRRFIPGPVHPVGGTPDADPEAGLRGIDPAALRAPPGRDVLGGLVGVIVGLVATQDGERGALRSPIRRLPASGPGSVPASVSTTGRHAPARARTADRSTSSASNSAALTSSSRCSEQAVSHVPSAPSLHSRCTSAP